MNKKKIVALLLGGVLIAGVAFNFATTASYREDLGTATQVVNAAKWDVKMGTQGEWNHTIFPGDVIGEDTITLTNNNDYVVKYTIELNVTDNGLNNALTLDLKNGEKSTGIIERDNKTIEVFVNKGITTLSSFVQWSDVETEGVDEAYGKLNEDGTTKSVEYKYKVVAEAMPEIKHIVNVTAEEDLMGVFENLKPNTLVTLEKGEYTIGANTGIELPGIPTSGKRNLVLHQDGTKIVGEPGTIIKPLINVNGAWSHQSTILVMADNVSIEGVIVDKHVNKTIEVVGDNFNLTNSTVEGVVYFNGQGPDAIKKFAVENNHINGSISITNGTGANGNKEDMIIKGNTMDNADSYLVSLTGLRPTGWDEYKSGVPTIEGNNFISNIDFLRISGEINGDRNGLLRDIKVHNTLKDRNDVTPEVEIVDVAKEYNTKPYTDSYLRVQ